jgi:hypothetical protein
LAAAQTEGECLAHDVGEHIRRHSTATQRLPQQLTRASIAVQSMAAGGALDLIGYWGES